MLTKKLWRRGLSLAAAVALTGSLAVGPAFAQEERYQQPTLNPHVKSIMEVDGYQFIDLNSNGELDVYEDWRQDADTRAADLVSQMTVREKISQMQHPTFLPRADGEIPSYLQEWCNEEGIGMLLIRELNSVEAAANTLNIIQEYAEGSRLGVPVLVSMDSVHGLSYVSGSTVTPHNLALAATWDEELVTKLAEIAREEHLAVGVRMALSPDADLITDPRWGRNQECYSEDTDVVQSLIMAAVQALQGGSELTEDSVIATVKHFPGSGGQTDGVDGTPLTIQEDSIDLHLAGFRAAIEAGVAAVMPYGYSTVPYLGGDAVENSADQSAAVMTDLLRGELGYTGLIQTDWGLNFVGATNAGADILGGAGVRSTRQLVEGVDEERLTDACRRILIAKFQLGIFENPYVDEENAAQVLGSQEHRAVAKEAAARSFTLLKYENASPLAGQKLVVAGTLAEDVRALNSGWTAKDPVELAGTTILEAFQNKAGSENVTYIPDASQVPADLSGTTAVVVIGEASGTHEPAWGTDTLEFPQEQVDLVKALKDAGANVVEVVLMNRAYVMTDMVDMADSVLLAYRPGVTYGAEAIADALFGETAITGKTPFQIPRTMEQVLNQREDLPKDIQDPLFEYGFGIEVESFGA